ncbi:MAG: hypothetical protein QNJ72_16710 [Pleurocapsa sp. MO_226.B13]|nr:hypothetical protein [Pleurocapsa sp. MO_226.B13]
MKVEEYLSQNQKSIEQQCLTIADNGNYALVTVKKNGEDYIYKVSTVAK